MRNVKSGVRMCQRKAEMSPFCGSGLPLFREEKLVAELWGCGREARECGQPVDNARRDARSMATRPSALSTGCPHAPKGVFFGTPIGRFLGHPPPQQGHPSLLGHPRQQGHPSRALPEPGLRAHRGPLDPGGDGCPCGRPGAMAVLAFFGTPIVVGTLLGHPPQQRHPSRALPEPGLRAHRDPLDPGGDGCPCGRPPGSDGCPCGRLRPTSTASCPPTSSAPLSRRPRLNGSSRGAARGHAGLPVRRLCGHGARDAILGRWQPCRSARVLESRDGQDHSHGRYPLALPG